MPRAALALLLFISSLAAAPVPKPAEKKPTLDGTWELASLEFGGRKVEEAQTWVIAGQSLVIRYGKAIPSDVKYALEVPKDGGPNEIDFVTRGVPGAVAGVKGGWTTTQQGVYALDGDTFTLCVAMRGADRPAECKPGKGLVVYTFKRVKEEKK